MDNEQNVTTTGNETVTTSVDTATPPTNSTKEETKVSTKTPEEEMAAMRVEMAKLKRALDKSSSETANYKKQLREKQTADEIAIQEKAEREAQREEEYQRLLKENTVNKYTKNFMTLGYPEDMASKAATAQYEGDMDELFKVQSDFQKSHDNALKAEWQKTAPQLNAGVGGSDKDIDPFLKGFGM